MQHLISKYHDQELDPLGHEVHGMEEYKIPLKEEFLFRNEDKQKAVQRGTVEVQAKLSKIHIIPEITIPEPEATTLENSLNLKDLKYG